MGTGEFELVHSTFGLESPTGWTTSRFDASRALQGCGTPLESLNFKTCCSQVKFCCANHSLTIYHLPFAICYRRSAIRSEAASLVLPDGKMRHGKLAPGRTNSRPSIEKMIVLSVLKTEHSANREFHPLMCLSQEPGFGLWRRGSQVTAIAYPQSGEGPEGQKASSADVNVWVRCGSRITFSTTTISITSRPVC
jgi:hypothetical protein